MRYLLLLALFLMTTAHADPLPSWQDTPVKKSILEFVRNVTDKASPHYVEPKNRIATFDNDGTLWVEQPVYTQIIFAIDRVKKLSVQHPAWKNQEPFSYILSDDKQALSQLTLDDIKKILAVTHSGMTVEEFNKMATEWLATTKNPRFKHLYTQTIYQPMLEVMNYLRKNDFKVYIVTGGGQDFVRAFSTSVYGVPVEQVIGTISKTKYLDQDNKPELIKSSSILSIDDGVGKPESIYFFIGQKPIIAFGNSDGDRQMLEWTQSAKPSHLMLLVHHDDAVREYAYGDKSKIGTFSDALMLEAQKNQWQIISMKNDWKVVFPFSG